MRAQAAPETGNIKQAEKIVEQRGLAKSLERRYARIEDIPYLMWRNKEIFKKKSEPVGVFGHMTPKDKK